MGLDIRSSLIVGLPYSELKPWLDQSEDGDADLEDLGLDYASPSYDSPRSNWVVGFAISNSLGCDVALVTIKLLFERFNEKTGLEPRLIHAPNVW